MEFTPYAFIDAVISFLPFYNACEKLSSYWGKARYIERTSLQAYADVRNHEMSLINANLPTTDFRQIFISSLPFGDDAHSEFNRDEFIDAITNPPSTRRRQVLQLNWLDKNELDAVGRFPCGLLIDAVNGNFGIIRIDQVVNYAKELENLFLRIVDHGLPGHIHISESDITSTTIAIIMENIVASKCSEIYLHPRELTVTMESLRKFLKKWNESPCTVKLDVRVSRTIGKEELENACGFQLTRSSSQCVNDKKGVRISTVSKGLSISLNFQLETRP
ncbi:hypothetical protein QR680_011872 [Steinernema hermaphroditum]|uniref:Uncharacterized protein n=1 Tax=Steinernema hermaphroditum TaxID=289476 RepID=A0AA39I195_9BILA|nr:hypothetical protein QR680_011872 [Steinernema hermaphroditum]